MNFCFRHGDREAFSLCHNCGKYFCKECLTEGKEYYYCQNSECQKQLMSELGKDNSQTGTEEKQINTVEKKFVKLNIELNQMDAAIFESLLENAGIDYYISSGHFFNVPEEFFVASDQIDEVKSILDNFNINAIYYSTKKDLTD